VKNSFREKSGLGAELALYALHVGGIHQRSVRQVPLLLRRFLGQDVTLESVLPLDFPTSREFEALLCA
jgi:hypothetical protein